MRALKSRPQLPSVYLDFLPDPDVIEQRPLAGVTHWVLLGLSGFLLFLFIWASLSDIDEVVSARGKLVSSQANVIIQPLETALIQQIDVRQGQVVKKGQRLAALDPTFASADAAQLRGGLSSLDARTRRLENELDNGSAQLKGNSDDALQSRLRQVRDANFNARTRAISENLARQEAAIQTNRQDQQVLEARFKSLQELEQMQERLVNQNFGAKQALLQARDRKLEVERDLRLTRNRENELLREIATTKAEKDAFQKDWQQRTLEELAEARRNRDNAAQQLKKAQRRQNLISLISPIDAIVLEVAPRSVGSVIREAEPFITLVPIGVPLEVELQVDAPDVGFLRIGQMVRVKLDAFPFQKHGTLNGQLKFISQDTFFPSQTSGGSAYYLSRATLTGLKLDRVDPDFQLLPGMTLRGEIRIGQKSVLSYFLYPIIGTLDQSLKEPR